jgi:hypothetical protein
VLCCCGWHDRHPESSSPRHFRSLPQCNILAIIANGTGGSHSWLNMRHAWWKCSRKDVFGKKSSSIASCSTRSEY